VTRPSGPGRPVGSPEQPFVTSRGVPTIRSPTIKIVSHVTYDDDLTIEEAREHHVDVHGPLGARIPGMRSYTLSYPIDPDAVDSDVLVETT
jgi:hypothetical protein